MFFRDDIWQIVRKIEDIEIIYQFLISKGKNYNE